MSFKSNKEYFVYDEIKKPRKKDKYLMIVYKLNENNNEKMAKIKELKETDWFKLNGGKEYKEDDIKIFGKYFVQKNKYKSKIIFNNKLYELKENFNEIDNSYNQNIKEIKLKLIGIDYITNMKKMFYGCCYLTSISEFKNKNNQNIINSQNDSDLIGQSNDLYSGCISSSMTKIFSKKSSSKLNSKNPLDFLPSISNYIFNKIKK